MELLWKEGASGEGWAGGGGISRCRGQKTSWEELVGIQTPLFSHRTFIDI